MRVTRNEENKRKPNKKENVTENEEVKRGKEHLGL